MLLIGLHGQSIKADLSKLIRVSHQRQYRDRKKMIDNEVCLLNRHGYYTGDKQIAFAQVYPLYYQ